MSKERARRRAEREAERARAIQANEDRQARLARRRAVIGRLTPRPVRVRRPGGLLARRHRTQNVLVALGFLIVQAIAWLLWGSFFASFAVLVLSVLLVPVVVTLAFDRRI
ncbi:hypothetical protein EDD27_1908 [Nonomuraea polychroma]|uniref:Uncharacterized protein n=1 Tax=Nonomuraea polychroma TaxID=46176 RepID=A0A438M166_9ACTN|nr:hypothetical protein [Nonomuraea polychroma]RVX39549.1 hypothetical protein EDD27_1908 [Nonomuraea polychroma]